MVLHPAGRLVSADAGNRSHMSRLASQGRATRLAPGLFLVGASLPVDRAVRHHRFAIIARYWPGAVLCDRTALSGGEPVEDTLFVCHPDPPRKADLEVAGLRIVCRVGPGPLPADMPMPEQLHLSGTARGLVENVPGRGRPDARLPRAAGVEAVENRIEEEARSGGAGRIRNLLAQLDVVAGALPQPAVALVRERLAGLVGTASSSPTSPRLRARVAGEPYDQHRVDLFVSFAELLQSTAPVPRSAAGGVARWEWLPFFESYFSNFIEGTRFDVEEARQIAIDGRESRTRPQDSHDIAATYRLARDPAFAAITPRSADELIEVLREQHSVLMAGRPEVHPGLFKTVQNYAGGHAFVAPELMEGTLRRGFDALAPLVDAFQRALGLMFLITECHPFDDGNGRLARLVMNAQLSAADQVRLVVPTVYRNDYLAGLTSASNGVGRGEALVSVMSFTQTWTAAIDWSSFDNAHEDVGNSHAYLDAGTAERDGRRLRIPPRRG